MQAIRRHATWDAVQILQATATDIDPAVAILAAAFASDPITGFLLQRGPDYHGRLVRFFSLLMRVRIALGMPVLLARSPAGIHGAAMGYTTERPEWPAALKREWDGFESAVPGLAQRFEAYDAIAHGCTPAAPHYYLGVIGVDPALHGQGIGRRLLRAFCAKSAAEPLSSGVYLETAQPANVPFYEAAGFAQTGQGRLGADTLWCLFLSHAARE